MASHPSNNKSAKDRRNARLPLVSHLRLERRMPFRQIAAEVEPYVLISILSAWHEGVFTLDEAQSTLEMLFDKQYILTVTEEVEVRYRTETRTDSEGNEYDVEVAYNYYILNVDLENFNLSHVPVYIMGDISSSTS